MDAASLLLGLLLGALLATAVTLGVVALRGRSRPAPDALEPVHESLDHLHKLLAGIERDRATAHGELREQVGAVGQTSLAQYPVEELTIAGTRTKLKHVVAVDIGTVVKALEGFAGKPVHGIIGQDVMREQHAVVDVQQSVLYLQPLEGAAATRTAAQCREAGAGSAAG